MRTIAGLASCALAGTCDPHSASFIGDSILAGTLVATKPPTYLQTIAASHWAITTITDQAVSGRTAAECLTAYNASVKAGTSGYNVLSCGVNSIRAGVSAAAVAVSLDAIADDTASQHRNLLWATVTPCKGSSYCDASAVAQLDLLNAHIRTKCSSLTNCSLVEVYNTFESGGVMRPACDNGDGLHLNDTCTQEYTRLFDAKLPQ